MKQHKWHKEIKHWADGGKIEFRELGWEDWIDWGVWNDNGDPEWCDPSFEYRIKSQPKEPQYLYVWEPYDKESDVVIDTRKPKGILDDGVYKYIGKVKLEVEGES
jgi:hypothetical protein